MNQPKKKKVIFMVGPTATGKTEIGFWLAKKIKGEIISCDSMQVYKSMEIISSQPPVLFKKQIPHHLTGTLSPAKEYNVSKYRHDALKKLEEIIAKSKTPIFVGGTGLYMTIVVDGIFKAKTESPQVREKLYKEAQQLGNEHLYNRLKEVDPQAASKIHINDIKRIVRALEVYETTGKLISLLQKQRKGITDKYEVRIFCLNMERNKINKRIEKRIKQMFENGLIEEVKELLKLKLSRTAGFAIGIRELDGYFKGEYSLDEAKCQMIRNTQKYVKRQLTWFRKDKRIKWIKINEGEKAQEVALKIWKELY